MGPLSRGGQSASGGLGAPQRHDGGAGPGDEPPLLVHDVALDEPDRAAALHDAPGGRELPRPDGLQEVDLELQRGERLALGEPRPVASSSTTAEPGSTAPSVKPTSVATG